jgi:endonuclease-3
MIMKMTEAPIPRPERIDEVFDLLEKMWGNEALNPDLGHDEPLDGLVLTLLSQNTNDTNRDRGFNALKASYPEWGETAAASKDDIAACIRPAGLANTKSERMLLILEKVRETFWHRCEDGRMRNALRSGQAGIPGGHPYRQIFQAHGVGA